MGGRKRSPEGNVHNPSERNRLNQRADQRKRELVEIEKKGKGQNSSVAAAKAEKSL